MNPHVDRKIKVWAYKNAYTLVFIACMFVVTWIIMLILSLIYGAPR